MTPSKPRGAVARAVLLRVAPVVVVAASALGCRHYAYYTRTTIQDFNLSPASLKNVQFYVDPPFTLRFKKNTSASTIRGYEVENTRERYEKHIEVVAMAGGEAVAVGEDWIKIQVAPDMTLEFRPDRSSRRGMYYLQAINDQPVEDGGTIHFRGNYYEVLFGRANGGRDVTHTGRPRLLYEASSVRRYRREREEVTGIWLKERDRKREEQEWLRRRAEDDGR